MLINHPDVVTPEQGSAREVYEGWWRYEIEVPGKVLVRAWDLAGNVVQGEG